MACCVSTSRRALTCPAGAPRRSTQSPTPSTPGHGRLSAGGPTPKPSTNTYAPSNNPVLRRPIESALTARVAVTDQLARLDGPALTFALTQRDPQRRHHQVGRLGRRGMSGHDLLREDVDDE